METKLKPYLTKPYYFKKDVPAHAEQITYNDISEKSGFLVKASGGFLNNINIFIDNQSDDHYKQSKYTYIIGTKKILTHQDYWSCILQVLAYSFHDYAIRETICNKNLFDKSIKQFEII